MLPAHNNDDLRWFKSSRSSGNGACVEVAFALPRTIAMRDSKDPHGPVLQFPTASWQDFVASVRQGEFDLPRS